MAVAVAALGVAAVLGVSRVERSGEAGLPPTRPVVRSAAARAGGLAPGDPRRIAVLYFDDHSPGRTLGYLADGFTERLIEQLAHVPALRVVSRNGVKPYRGDAAVPSDSLRRALDVGTVVEGSVQRSAGRLRVTVQLIDAADNTPLDSRTFERPEGELLGLQDDLIREVSGFLLRRLGEVVVGHEVQSEAHDAKALDFVLRAERERKDGQALAASPRPGDRQVARAAFDRADTLLAAAERFDSAWQRPVVQRGWIRLAAAQLDTGAARATGLRTALAAAERAVARAPGAADALALRGTVWWALRGPGPGGQFGDSAAARAAVDLRAALDRDSTLATAWATLSMLQRWRGEASAADASARRALAADAYLDNAGDVMVQLYRAAMTRADADSARAWCARGRATFAADWRFVECELTVMHLDVAGLGGRPPDPKRAWAVVNALDALDPAPVAREAGHSYSPIYRRLAAAAVSAAAGDAARARQELARARADAGMDPVLRVNVLHDEAFLRLALGEREGAEAALRAYLAARPEWREAVVGDPMLLALGMRPAAVLPAATAPVRSRPGSR